MEINQAIVDFEVPEYLNHGESQVLMYVKCDVACYMVTKEVLTYQSIMKGVMSGIYEDYDDAVSFHGKPYRLRYVRVEFHESGAETISDPASTTVAFSRLDDADKYLADMVDYLQGQNRFHEAVFPASRFIER